MDKKLKNFSLVAFIEDEVRDKIIELQKKLYEITGSRKCLNDWLPHITVGDGIIVDSKQLKEVESQLLQFSKTQKPLTLTFKKFGGKTDRKVGIGETSTPYVLWIEVEMDTTLKRIAHDIEKITKPESLWFHMPRPYNPHITVAFRDLDEAGYKEGVKYLKNINIKGKTKITSISLVERLTDGDKEYKRFILG